MSEALIISGEADSAEVKRVPLFAIPRQVPNPAWRANGGDDPEHYDFETPEFIEELVTYDMPAEVNPVLGLEYGERSGINAAAASAWIIQEVVGEAGYRALKAELKKMSPKRATAMLEQVSNRIGEIALGN